MMDVKDKVYISLQECLNESEKIPTSQIADNLHLSRQIVTHYLNQLFDEEKVKKTDTRPTYWYIEKEEQSASVEEELDSAVFDSMIGATGSHKKIVEMCKASVSYPPHGLPILIIGESGVGKSYIAKLIYNHALQTGNIDKKAPFVVLNCADYANNPELLSATLLGYKKGSFTGADSDKTGLLQEADGGYLFLDEVHRLSFENQEKLFVFMDTGKYRPLGDSKWRHSNVRFIFATTENPQEVLLETFRRRITLQISIPNITERPLQERIELIETFYKEEAEKIKKNLTISSGAVKMLCFSKFPGNIGRLRNLIQVSCAEAYFKHGKEDNLLISEAELIHAGGDIPVNTTEFQTERNMEISIIWNQPKEYIHQEYYDEYHIEIINLFHKIETASWSQIDQLYLNFRAILRKISPTHNNLTEQRFFTQICKDILIRYGVKMNDSCGKELYILYTTFNQMRIDKEQEWKLKAYFEQSCPRAFYVANRIIIELKKYELHLEDNLSFLFALAIHEYISESLELNGLIAAHGDTTASSIAKVVNQACGTFIMEGIDMPMDTTLDQTVEKVQNYLLHSAKGKGLILLVDTGSLSSMYSKIKNNLSGDLLIINNVSTAIALDVGLKMLGHGSFEQIVESTKRINSFDVQFFEGLSKNKNILISCMSGVGIAEKIQEIMKKTLGDCGLDFVTMEYKELLDLLNEDESKNFDQTLMILTTSPLHDGISTPWLSVYDILDGHGEENLWNALRSVVTPEQFEALKNEFVRFFTIEGIVSRLQFLNPTVVIQDVETILHRYQDYYKMEMSGHIRLNLYMHIAFMFERLMTADDIDDEEEPTNPSQKEFYRISKIVFQDVEKKYRIHLDNYELSILYELLSKVIKEPIGLDEA
jgi:sigma-54 dependent transcriptional regulator of gfr operon